jgi:DNA invertase Pin-like site-specific DNA recombinase
LAVAMVGELRRREIGFTSLHERLDTTTPGGRLIFHVFAALAEFVRELIVSATREGLDAARARGKVGGRPSVVNADIIRAARDMLPNPEHSITSIARLLGVSPGTLYNHIPDLQELRSARVAAQIEGGTR